jgi:hypothetical protein
LRVIETDPHAHPIPWPGPTARSITRPVELGLSEDGQPVTITILRRNVLVGGTTGAGKSGILNIILGALVACGDVEVWGVDLKGGMELQPWAGCLGRPLATTPEEANQLFRDAVTKVNERAARMAAEGKRVWEPMPDDPALIVVVDEYAELPEEAHDCADSIARRGRAVAVNLIAATQRPTQQTMGKHAVRSQMDVRICLRVRERRDVDLVLGQGSFTAGWHAHALTQPGTFLVSAPEHTVPQRYRAYLITDDQLARHAAQHASTQPALPVTGPGTSPRAPGSPVDGEQSPAGTQKRGHARDGTVGRTAHRWARRRVGGRPSRRDRHEQGHALPAPAGARGGRAGHPDPARLLARAAARPARRWPATTKTRPVPAARPRATPVTDSDRLSRPASRAPARVGPHTQLRRDDETTTHRNRKGGEDRQPTMPTLSAEDRAAIRRAGAEDARRSRAGQGLPERIEDPATIATLAAMLGEPPSISERPCHDWKPAA